MSYDVITRHTFLPHQTIKKNVITVILAFPAVALVVFFLFNPLNTAHPLIRASYEMLVKNTGSYNLQEKTANRNYTIHVWMHGKRMKRRFLRSYGKKDKDPYRLCSVRNCVLTIEDSEYARADAVLFHLHQTKGPSELPAYHPPHQMWIFFTDESPYHTFYASRKYSMKDYNDIFNWSMTYRRDSDIPVPYGRTVRLTPKEIAVIGDLPDFSQRKNLTVAVLGSNCGGQNHRWGYVRELQKHIPVDIYGHCGKLRCPGHFTRDCQLINKYKFYLAFENTNCREYITEKMWWNAYEKESVPVVMGAPKRDYEDLCPPHSFIHVDDYSSPAELASYIQYLDHNDTAYNLYFQWKLKYKVLNEHGYFGSPSLHLCRICEKLNAKKLVPKTYRNLTSFWNKKKDCFHPLWRPKKS